MKKLLCSSLALLLLFTSCKKDKDDNPSVPDNSVEATIDGAKVTLWRGIRHAASVMMNSMQKRLDINCISTDKKHRIVLTIGNYVLTGDGIDVKTYNITMFTQDDFLLRRM